MIFYNFVCSSISFYTFLGFVYGLHNASHIFSKESSAMLKPIFLLYWITKNLELLDTVFMILRHKRRQISFLHVYHHASMLILSDYAYRHSPWPAIAIFLCINSLVHVILYFYYGLTAWKPSVTPTWKAHLTEMQIIQFLIDFVYAFIGYLYHGFCIYGFIYGFKVIVA